jgi:hypothetical protein
MARQKKVVSIKTIRLILLDTVKELVDELEGIPPETQVEFDGESCYLEVFTTRDETDEEMYKRENSQVEWRRKRYEELKAEFESKE